MDKQEEILQMLIDDSAAMPPPAPNDAMGGEVNITQAAPVAMPDAMLMDLTPAAIVDPTDLDKKVRASGKRSKPAIVATTVVADAATAADAIIVDAAKSATPVSDVAPAEKETHKRKHQDEREETMRVVLGGDDDEDDDYDEEEDGEIMGEEELHPKKHPSSSSDAAKSKPKSKSKPKKAVATAAADAKKSKKRVAVSDGVSKLKKKKRSKKMVEPDVPASGRRQPGHAMIRAEYDRITRALDALVRKRIQRDESNEGEAPTTVCGILIDNLVDFYEQDVLIPFERKFARYMN